MNYTIDIHILTGGIDVVLGPGAHIGNIELAVTTGNANLIMTDDVVLLGSPTFNLSVTTGHVDIVADLPTGVGGSIEGAIQTGDIDITATGWTAVTSNHYKTNDYESALQSLTLIADVTTGDINAVVS